jgi:GT2 family glycosyltransferase
MRPLDEIIVVDNGSTDNTADVVDEHNATLVRFPVNRGFAEAVNEGIRHAAGEWVFILNNDVLLDPAFVGTLLAAAEEEGADFAAGKILQRDPPGVLDGSWDLVSRGAYAWRCGYGRQDGGVWSQRRKISLAPMTAALFRRDIFDRIGWLETRFESYYEDVDFGVRCAVAGLKGIYEPAAVCFHLGKATYGKRAARVYFLSARNQVLLLAKHYRRETLRRFAWAIFVGQMLALFAATKQGHPIAALRGKWQALQQWGTFRKGMAEDGSGAAQALEAAVSESEREILELQKQTGFDIYWRLYFSLVRPG